MLNVSNRIQNKKLTILQNLQSFSKKVLETLPKWTHTVYRLNKYLNHRLNVY